MMDKIQETLTVEENSRTIETENGGLGFATTGAALLDMNFKVSSYRNLSDNEIIADFAKAYNENKELALKWLFFARDVREGLGERRLFRVISKWLATRDISMAINIKHIPEFGRWDDIIEILQSPLNTAIVDVNCRNLIRQQIKKDLLDRDHGLPISLLGKWMPSINASSEATRRKARQMADILQMTPRVYRKTLSKLRAHLDVVEVKMTANKWDAINYEAVPSIANVNYRTAFMRHDNERRTAFLSALEKGEVKINASTNFPHDIVSAYSANKSRYSTQADKVLDITLEEMWKRLPNYGLENTLVVADGSGSMTSGMAGNAQPIDVANALAVYCSERNSGEFKNKYITFSECPQFVDLSKASSLLDKINIANMHNEVANTNINRVFKLILKTAMANKMTQEDMVANVLIISDMEFDEGTTTNATVFEEIKNDFADAGYKLPRLIFWNTCSRTNVVPIQENENGVALVSGFSVHILKMVMSGKLDAWEVLKNVLLSERYEKIIAS